MRIPNYDVQDDVTSNHKQKYKFMPDKCFRMLVVAPSGRGKNQSITGYDLSLLYFEKKYLYGKNLQQSKYQTLIQTFEPISKEAGYY